MSAFLNLLALAVHIFTLQVYDRVVGSSGISTLEGVLIGMVIVLIFDYVLRQSRSRIMQRVDIIIGRKLFDKVMSLPLQALEAQPATYWTSLFRDVDIGRIRELLSESTKQRQRATIKSPILGVVKNMRYHTIGGTVKAGEPIMEIVPTGEKLVVNARLSPTDRAFVEAGQKVTINLSAYDFARYGELDGTVQMVAPDSSNDDKGNPYFRLVIETKKTYLGVKEGPIPDHTRHAGHY